MPGFQAEKDPDMPGMPEFAERDPKVTQTEPKRANRGVSENQPERPRLDLTNY
jgi:hypothetical protein